MQVFYSNNYVPPTEMSQSKNVRYSGVNLKTIEGTETTAHLPTSLQEIGRAQRVKAVRQS